MIQLTKQEREYLESAQAILLEAGPGDEESDFVQWARLVVDRHAQGHSLKNADDWYGSLMIGVDPEHLE